MRRKAACVALAGAQAAIQLAPRLRSPGEAAVLGPTYNEHAAAFRTAGWRVREEATLDALSGADAAVVVNPNNPDGRRHAPDALLALGEQVGLLLVDESFADPDPELSLCPHLVASGAGIIVQRSFGKFFGLAGIRLGFALGPEAEIARLRDLAGPWAVNGPAVEIGRAALADWPWRMAMSARLWTAAARLDTLAERVRVEMRRRNGVVSALWRRRRGGDARPLSAAAHLVADVPVFRGMAAPRAAGGRPGMDPPRRGA